MKTASSLFLLFISLAAPAAAEDWPHFRGPDRTDIVKEVSGWKGNAWLPENPLWTKKLGNGATSPLVIGSRLYTLGYADGQDTVYCLDCGSGKEIWKVSYKAPEYGRFKIGDEGIYSGPNSTPEFDVETGWLYTLSNDGDLNCWDTKNQGRKVWGLNLYDEYGVEQRPKIGRQALRDYGYTSSPLLLGDSLIVEVGSKNGNMVAFARQTGKQLWVSENQDPAGHNAGPAPISVEAVPCVAVLTTKNLVVTRTDAGHKGKTVAEFPWATDFANNVASPAVHGDCVLVTSGYNHHAIVKLKITLQGAKKLWEKPLASKVCTPVIHGGRVYWSWGTLKCLDWETGDLKWEGGQFRDPGSCIVTADDRLIVWGGTGKLALVETAKRSPDKYLELESKDRLVSADSWPHVVLAGGQLYLKDWHGNLKCFKLVR